MKQFWLNLPVKDIAASTAFFTALGFKFNQQQSDGKTRACLLLGDSNVVCMLFDQATFKNFINNEQLADKSTEVLLSVDAQSKESVDEMAQKAIAAGGASNHVPTEMTGFMYGCVFSDLDGHKWNVLYMDMSKMPKA